MSVGEGLGKTLGIGVLAAAVIGAVWLFRDRIAGWFTSAVTAPVTGAVSGAVESVQALANTPVVTAGQTTISGGDILRMLTPGLGIGAVWNTVTGATSDILGQRQQPGYEQVIAPTAYAGVPTEADILWQAKLAEVSPPPSGPAPSGYQVRGTSLTGAPLYEPIQAMLGTIPIPDAPGTVGEVWQLGPSRLVKIGDVWLGENISACYLSGGWWDAPRGRCIYGA